MPERAREISLEEQLEVQLASLGRRGRQHEDRLVRFALPAVDHPTRLQVVVDRVAGGVVPSGETMYRAGELARLAVHPQRDVRQREITERPLVADHPGPMLG